MTTFRFGIRFGALSPSIAEQIADQGFFLNKAQAKRFQAFADATVRLHVNGFLTDGEVHKARRRIMRDLRTAIEVDAPKPAKRPPVAPLAGRKG
jgi:bisphosphoglycerate-independent phosphoglycerate mutase (AlkP superfamily)